MVASMLTASALRNVRRAQTIASPWLMSTSKRVAMSGIGCLLPATKPPAMNAWSGSTRVFGAVMRMVVTLLQEFCEKLCNTIDQSAAVRAAAEQVRIDDERDAGRDRKRGALSPFQQQLDRSRRKAEVTQPRIALDGRDVVVAVVCVGATAARRRHEALGDQITHLSLW